MRKLWIAVLALAAVVAVAGVAIAANTYVVHVGSATKKGGKGSVAHPVPAGIKLGFKVGETDPTKRATVVEKYALGVEGVTTNTNAAPRCKFSQAASQTVSSKCGKALVGDGLVKNAAGSSADQSLEHSSPCNLKLRLYNIGTGMAIRLDSFGRPQPPDFETNQVGCLLPIATAIKATFVKTKIAGRPASDLRFSVPLELKHPLPGIDNSIRETVTSIKRIAKVIRGKPAGFYQKVGCKGGKRTTRVTFTTEATSTQAPQKSTATKQSAC